MDDDAKIEALQEYLTNKDPQILLDLADSELAAHLADKNEHILHELISDLEARKETLEHELSLKEGLLNGQNYNSLPLSTTPAAQCLDIISSEYLTGRMGLGSEKECNDLFKQLLVLAPDNKWLQVSSSPLIDFLVSNHIVEHKFQGGLLIKLW